MMAELSLRPTPLHQLRVSKTPRYWGAGVKGGLHQLLEDSLALVEDDEAWLEEARAGGSEVPFGRIEC